MSINITLFNESGRRVKKTLIIRAIETALQREGIEDAIVRIILLNNNAIRNLNNQFLKHDYPTDVLSFRIDDTPLEGEIYIGVEIAEEQSLSYNVSLANELRRLAVHGLLHILGYNDKNDEQKSLMTQLEDKYIDYKGLL